MTTNVKGESRNVTWCIWQVLAHKSRTRSPRNTKIGREVACHTAGLLMRPKKDEAKAEARKCEAKAEAKNFLWGRGQNIWGLGHNV